MIRVLIADDSGFMRLALRRMIEAESDLRVVGEAADGLAAVEQAAALRPDVVAMDLEMPGLDGVEATRRIMAMPDPPAVVMVSHHTRDGSAAALAALAAGAADTIWKGSALSGLGALDLGELDAALRVRLRHWAAVRAATRGMERVARSRRPAMAEAGPPPVPPVCGPPPLVQQRLQMVVIGASTGGPDAITAVLKAAGPLPVPVLVAQHMPADLGAHFASHLAERTGVPAVLGSHGMALPVGCSLLLPGGADGHVTRGADGGFILRLAPGHGAVHPSVDVLFRSVAVAADRALGVVLTGMGRDGTAGAEAMARRGMAVVAQSPESCVVAGMPGSLIAAGLAAEVAAPEDLGRHLARWTRPR